VRPREGAGPSSVRQPCTLLHSRWPHNEVTWAWPMNVVFCPDRLVRRGVILALPGHQVLVLAAHNRLMMIVMTMPTSSTATPTTVRNPTARG
jgi:hypothetical protein